MSKLEKEVVSLRAQLAQRAATIKSQKRRIEQLRATTWKMWSLFKYVDAQR